MRTKQKKYHTKDIIPYNENQSYVYDFLGTYSFNNLTDFYLFVKDLYKKCNEKEKIVLQSILDGISKKNILKKAHIHRYTYEKIIKKFIYFFKNGII